ncbi:MAG: dTDP-4-dehydrorhamnose 3,5-epimerase [Solirubrobacterales bacterium]|jgi:dTDP-4-dehydrorhamnose 3,5-epimerase|nr:dTDP-4-dehydrorhamnose 3,5-epimerase [Solirubrobacterales bacterium]
MRRIETRLAGPVLIEPVVHRDARGFFQETYRRTTFADLGIDDVWVQDNHSRSSRGVVRGIHYQPGMAKLVRCATGAIVDVLVDLRRGSPTFGEWEAFGLDEENARQLYCPDGFGHAFCVVSDLADVLYKCSAYYEGAAERAIAFDDPEIGIEWPAGLELKPSERDRGAPALNAVESSLPFSYGG